MTGLGYTEGAPNSFAHSFVVEGEHIDRLGHANNVVILQWIQDVAEAHSAAVGFPFTAYEKMGCAFVVRRHELDYLRPAMRGQRVRMRTWVDSAKGVSCTRYTEISTDEPAQLVAKAMTTWVFAELETARIVRIPDDVRVAFGFQARTSSIVPAAAETS